MRVARVLAGEQQRPEVVVEVAEELVGAAVVGTALGACRIDLGETLAEEGREPAVDVELLRRAGGAGCRRSLLADRRDQPLSGA